jgi:hypothetical protein
MLKKALGPRTFVQLGSLIYPSTTKNQPQKDNNVAHFRRNHILISSKRTTLSNVLCYNLFESLERPNEIWKILRILVIFTELGGAHAASAGTSLLVFWLGPHENCENSHANIRVPTLLILQAFDQVLGPYIVSIIQLIIIYNWSIIERSNATKKKYIMTSTLTLVIFDHSVRSILFFVILLTSISMHGSDRLCDWERILFPDQTKYVQIMLNWGGH